MIIIEIKYRLEFEKVEQHLSEHIEFLNEQYELGHFLVSGRKVPRDGGIILSNVDTKKRKKK